MKNLKNDFLFYEKLMKSEYIYHIINLYKNENLDKNCVVELSSIFRRLLRNRSEDQLRSLHKVSAEMRYKNIYNENSVNFNNIFIECLHNEILRPFANKIDIDLSSYDEIYERCKLNNMEVSHKLVIDRLEEMKGTKNMKVEHKMYPKEFYTQRGINQNRIERKL